jgi:polysaccharide deacetylase family protein (PEP-CTERM system associated)
MVYISQDINDGFSIVKVTCQARSFNRKNAFSVDLEDYYTGKCRPYYPLGFVCLREVEANTMRLLAILAEHRVRATFFCIAETVSKLPSLLHGIILEGHEIALHGLRHEPVRRMPHPEFAASIEMAKNIIEQITGHPILGYRAPYGFLPTPDSLFLDTLVDLGFAYDSSILPRLCSQSITNQAPFFWSNGLLEVPLSSATIGHFCIHPIGGGYFRHLPLRWVQYCIKLIEKRNIPIIFYCHPYELEPSFPIMPNNKRPCLSLYTMHLRQYHNRGEKQTVKLKKLLKLITFIPLRELLMQDDIDGYMVQCSDTARRVNNES